jgi:steroid delta-isomerase-like uncharacterized protein
MATSAPPDAASNADLIRWAFEVLNTRDITALRTFWTDATVERLPQRTCYGSDAIARYFEEAFAALPDFDMKVVCIVAQGDDVFAHWHLTGTHTGAAFDGIAATGRPIALDGIDHFVIRDGEVVSNFVVFDQMQFARQIGLLPPDGTRADKAVKRAFNTKTQLLNRLRPR